VGRGILRPEFAKVGALPAAAGLGAGRERGGELREVLANAGGECGAGAVELEAAGQFIGEQSEVERLAVGRAVGQELVGRLGPGRAVVAAGRSGVEV
jgi:hypothetical protein